VERRLRRDIVAPLVDAKRGLTTTSAIIAKLADLAATTILVIVDLVAKLSLLGRCKERTSA
jgi:hypothetical protein